MAEQPKTPPTTTSVPIEPGMPGWVTPFIAGVFVGRMSKPLFFGLTIGGIAGIYLQQHHRQDFEPKWNEGEQYVLNLVKSGATKVDSFKAYVQDTLAEYKR
eukprot:Colp12_sorted_trinity150504_noHs@1717